MFKGFFLLLVLLACTMSLHAQCDLSIGGNGQSKKGGHYPLEKMNYMFLYSKGETKLLLKIPEDCKADMREEQEIMIRLEDGREHVLRSVESSRVPMNSKGGDAEYRLLFVLSPHDIALLKSQALRSLTYMKIVHPIERAQAVKFIEQLGCITK